MPDKEISSTPEYKALHARVAERFQLDPAMMSKYAELQRDIGFAAAEYTLNTILKAVTIKQLQNKAD